MANDIEVKVGAQTQELEAGMGRASQAITNALSGIQQQMSTFSHMLSGVAGLAGGAGLTMLAQQAVGVMSSFEQLEIRLNSVMGSAEKGQQAFGWIQQFAKDTPFQVSEVTQSFMLLKNMGIDPMGGAMKAIADRAAQTGGGFETLQRISLGLGQAWTKGKLQGEEAMQLLEAGVPVWDMLAKILGKTTEEVQELSEKGRLGRDVIKSLIDEMGRSSDGAAVAQMQSLGGMWSNFIDNIQGGLNRLRKDGALDPLKSMLSEMNEEFDRLEKNGTLARWSADVAANLKAVGAGLMSTGKFIADYGDQILLLAEAYVVLKAAQAGSQMVGGLADSLQKRVAAAAAARDLAAADLQAANTASVAAKHALLLADAEQVAAQAELRRAAAQASTSQTTLQAARAETDLAARTRLTTQAQSELTAALAARNAAVTRAATATDTLNRANAAATASTQAATTAQIAFERATTLAGLAARGFSTVMTMLGGPIGIAIMACAALATHWRDIGEAFDIAAVRAENAAERIKTASQEASADAIKQLTAERDTARSRMQSYDQRLDEGGSWQYEGYGKKSFRKFTEQERRDLMEKRETERGILIAADAAIPKVQNQRANDAVKPITDKYEGESEEGRKRIDERNKQKAAGTPQLLPEKEKKAKTAPSRLGDWNNELEGQRLNAEMSGSRMSAQQEADFWAQKLELTKAGSKEREQVVRQHTRALLAIEREGDQNARALEQAQFDAKRQSLTTALQADEASFRRQAELQGLSVSEQEATLIGFEQRRLAIQQAFIDERLAALQRDPDHNIAEVYRLQQEREQAEVQHQMRLSEIKGQSLAADAQPGMDSWQGAEGNLGGMYEDGLQRMLQGTLSFKEAIQGVWAEIGRIMVQNLVLQPAAALAAKYTREIAQEGAHQATMFAIEQGWITRKLALKLGLVKADTIATATGETVKTSATIVGETSRTGAATVGAATRTSLSAGEAITNILNSAYEAMAGAFKAIVGIPYVGPALAVGAGAAAFAAVAGIVGKVKSASGGYSIPRGVNPMTQLHEEEMVLPKPYANVIREMAEGRGGNAGGEGNQNAIADSSLPPIQLSGVSAGEFFLASRKDLLKVLKAARRDFVGS